MASGSFLGGFADAFVRTQAQQQQLQQNKAFKDAQLKKFKADLELQEQQANAQGALMSRLSPEMGPPQSFSSLLASPEGPGMLLQSGMLNAKDILQEQRLSQGQQMLNQLLVGLDGGQGGQPQVDPVSLMVARATGDVTNLKSPRIDELDKPLSPSEILKIPGAVPGMTMRDVQQRGLNVKPESELKIEQKLRPAEQIVSDLKGVVGRVFTNADFLDRAVKGFEMGQQKFLRNDSDIVYLMDFESKLAPLVKALGEAGALAEGDVERAEKNIPKLFPIPDPPDVANAKVAELERLIAAAANRIGERSTDDQTVTVEPEFYQRMQELQQKQLQDQ